MKRKTIEDNLHRKVCLWMKRAHRDVIFISSTKETGNKRTRIKNSVKNSQHRHPDLMILKTSLVYAGLFIELKKPDLEPSIIKYCHLTKDEKQEILNKKHNAITNRQRIIGQWQCLSDLRKEGYMTSFSCSFSETVDLIEAYLDTCKEKKLITSWSSKYLFSQLTKYNLWNYKND
jgi:hypothetical protein